MKHFFIILTFFYNNLLLNASANNIKFVDEKSNLWAFEENKGQVTGEDSTHVNFFFKQGNKTMFLLKSGIAYQFEKITYPLDYIHLDKFSKFENNFDYDILQKQIKRETYRMDIELIGANNNCKITSEGKSKDYIQYYNHNTLDVHAYSKITYHDIYPNIDWVIYIQENEQNNQSQITNIKYDFIVHRGGNPDDIKLKSKWVEDLKINNTGNLSFKNRLGEVVENKPVSFQEGKVIKTEFILQEDTIKFLLKDYDKENDFVIDPTIAWATYYGGLGEEFGLSCAIGDSGSVYHAGYTSSTTSIASGGYQNTYGGNPYDAYLVKFTSNGTRLWATYYGGNLDDVGRDCIVDYTGSVYLTGDTYSSTGIASGGFQNTLGGGRNAYLVKFTSSGALIWGTYYGSSWESGFSCSVDNTGNVFLAGQSCSSSGIASGGFQNTLGGSCDAILVKFSSAGSRLWATYYGGSTTEVGYSCAVDNSGDVYLSGTTYSTSGIASGGFQNTFGGGFSDAFLVKFSSSGARLWATYYGGADSDGSGAKCAVDNTTNEVYLSATTGSSSNIASGGFQNTMVGFNDAYLVKFSSSGTRLWATYFGGNNQDLGFDCTVDDSGFIYLAGITNSTSGMAIGGFKNTFTGSWDGFVTKFSSSGSRLWASYYGGNANESLRSIKSKLPGLVYFAGYTASSSSISTSGGFQNTFGGASNDAFLVKLDEIIPKIIISKNISDSICLGDSVIFSSSIEYGGSQPKYFWYKNGILVDTNSNYSTSNITNNDSIRCLLKSNLLEAVPDSAWSNKIVLKFRPKDSSSVAITICNGKSIIVKGKSYNSSGMYLDTFKNRFGCDSIVLLNLSVSNSYHTKVISKSICNNQSYFFNEINLSTAGVYIDTLISSNLQCDTIVTLTLSIIPNSIYSFSKTICANQSYLFKGKQLKTAGIYHDTLVNSNNCDSFLTLTLTVNINDSTYISQSICKDKSYLFNGKLISSPGIYYDTFQSMNGCDSFIVLNLSLKRTDTTYINQSICSNQSYFFNGQNLNTSGIFYNTLSNSIGCDSFIFLNLNVNPIYKNFIKQKICSGQLIFFNGTNHTKSGTYTEKNKSINGCDSIINLDLIVLPSVKTDTSHIYVCNPYFLQGKKIERDTSFYSDTIFNSLKCDSIYKIKFIHVKSKPIYLKDTSIIFCDNITVNNKYYTQSFSYTDTIRTSDMLHCDSIYLPKKYILKTTPNLILKLKPEVLVFTKGELVTIEASKAENYRWNTGDSTQIINKKVTEETYFEVIAWNSSDCPDTAQVKIYVEDIVILDLPNSFSPESTFSQNRVFKPNYWGKITVLYFTIFNRWGEKIFSTSKTNEGWDGTYKGVIQSTGIYTYLLEYEANRNIIFKTGEVLLVK